MKKIILLLAIFISSPALAAPGTESCLVRGRSVDYGMINAMVSDLGVIEADIQLDKTEMQLIDKQKVTHEMALMYARDDKKIPGLKMMKVGDLITTYEQDNPLNVIVKYDYQNKKGRHNIMMASLVINDYECSVRFNGYLVVKREF